MTAGMAAADPASTPLPAATVLLLRPAEPQLQVLMVVRHEKIDFASGALVFPGGKVDAADGDPLLAPYISGADAFDDLARAFRVAAIREAFEESGVLLARERGSRDTLPANRLNELASYRKGLESGEVTMLDLVTRENLQLATDLLIDYSHWVTPAFVPKRFDTWFFLARAPADQIAVHDGRELVDSVWISPATALEDLAAKRRTILFPTRLNLMMLDESRTTDEAFDAARVRPIKTVEPRISEREGSKWLTIDSDAGYALTEIPVDPNRHARSR